MIYGIGIDIVDVERFKRALDRWGERFRRRFFNTEELEYCLGRRRPEVHLAARFAAKEAVIKALGNPVPLKNIEILRDPSGKPLVKVAGLSEDYRFHVSITHEKKFCVAQVVVERL